MAREKKWREKKDYSNIPKNKWCDLDYMAVWIREQGYTPETSMENLGRNIINCYKADKKVVEDGYFVIEDMREHPRRLMVFVPDIAEYVKANNGISAFDVWSETDDDEYDDDDEYEI